MNMTLTVNVSPEAESRLQRRAKINGIPLTELISEIVEEASRHIGDHSKPMTGAELVAQLEADGVVGAWANRPDITDSAQFARELRQRAEHRNW